MQHNLLPDGDSVPVTASNRLLYVYLLADWHLNARLGRAASAFASEFDCSIVWYADTLYTLIAHSVKPVQGGVRPAKPAGWFGVVHAGSVGERLPGTVHQ